MDKSVTYPRIEAAIKGKEVIVDGAHLARLVYLAAEQWRELIVDMAMGGNRPVDVGMVGETAEIIEASRNKLFEAGGGEEAILAFPFDAGEVKARLALKGETWLTEAKIEAAKINALGDRFVSTIRPAKVSSDKFDA